MIYQVSNIRRDVRVALDEDRDSDVLVASDGDVDALKLDALIESKVAEAVKRVEMEAPYYMLEQGHNFQFDNDGLDNDNNGYVDDERRGIFWSGTDTCGFIMLPEDFMRMVVFEMSDWERPVYEAITPADPRYARQWSRVKGVRGTAERPVVAVGVRPEGKVLEFWSCKSQSATVTRAVYVPYPVVDSGGGIEISEQCYPAVVYMAAGLTLVSCGEVERSKAFFELSKTYLER